MVHITEGEWLTAQEAAVYFKVSRERLAQLLRAGRIPYLQVGRQFIIRKDVADAFKVQKRKPGRPKLLAKSRKAGRGVKPGGSARSAPA